MYYKKVPNSIYPPKPINELSEYILRKLFFNLRYFLWVFLIQLSYIYISTEIKNLHILIYSLNKLKKNIADLVNKFRDKLAGISNNILKIFENEAFFYSSFK